jgi:prepilin-type processing-associated H-X9-DG protein
MSRRRAITLVEVIVVVLIIVLLLAMLLPAVAKVRELASFQLCKSRLRDIAIASHNYHNDYARLPSGYYSAVYENGNNTRFAENRGPHIGVLVMLLWYLEQEQLYQRLPHGVLTDPADSVITYTPWLKLNLKHEYDAWWNEPGNLQPSTGQVRVDQFHCPSDNLYDEGVTTGIVSLQIGNGGFAYITTPRAELLGLTNYVGVAGAVGAFDRELTPTDPNFFWHLLSGSMRNRSRTTLGQLSVLDGTANTLLFGESLGGLGQPGQRKTAFTWFGAGALGTAYGLADDRGPGLDAEIPPPLGSQPAPGTLGASWFRFSSRHPGKVNFVWADASARSLRVKNTAVPDLSNKGLNNSEWIMLQRLAAYRDGINTDTSCFYE